MSYEVELLAIAIAFYLYDSSVLLYSNEVIFTFHGTRGWSAASGWFGFVFAGRTLCMLNPLTPHFPSYRLSWAFDALPDAKDVSWSEHAQGQSDLAPWTLAGGIALFVLLPLGMFTFLGRYLVIPALSLLYGSTLVALYKLSRSKGRSTFGARSFRGFAFECIACPPFSVNMVRRMTLAHSIAEPAPLAAARLLDGVRWTEFREECLSRLNAAIQLAGDAATEVAALQAQKQRLSALVSRI